MPEQISTICVSGQPTEFNTGNWQCSFDIYFTPPEPVSGQSCYLQVRHCSIMEEVDEGSTVPESTYLVSFDWRQPNSFASIYDEINIGTNYRKGFGFKQSNPYNNVVAIVNRRTLELPANVEFPRVLVDIPEGPHTLKITVSRVPENIADLGTTNASDHLPWNVSLLADLIPVDSM